MRPTLAIAFSFSFVLFACADGGAPIAPTTNSNPTASTPASSNMGACDALADAMIGRTDRCKDERSPIKLATKNNRDAFVYTCTDRLTDVGTGYSKQGDEACAKALATAACGDFKSISTACWEPKGQLAVGDACRANHQCQSGFCEGRDGKEVKDSCGKCGASVVKKFNETCKESWERCDKGLECYASRYCKRAGEIEEFTNGLICGFGKNLTDCGPGFTCSGKGNADTTVCERIAFVGAGESCGSGADCKSNLSCTSGVCTAQAQKGQSCDGEHPECADFLVCSSLGICELPELNVCK